MAWLVAMPGQPWWAAGKAIENTAHCIAETARPPVTLAVWHVTREVGGDPGAAAPGTQVASWVASGIYADDLVTSGEEPEWVQAALGELARCCVCLRLDMNRRKTVRIIF